MTALESKILEALEQLLIASSEDVIEFVQCPTSPSWDVKSIRESMLSLYRQGRVYPPRFGMWSLAT